MVLHASVLSRWLSLNSSNRARHTFTICPNLCIRKEHLSLLGRHLIAGAFMLILIRSKILKTNIQ